jgi:hypothetical protein
MFYPTMNRASGLQAPLEFEGEPHQHGRRKVKSAIDVKLLKGVMRSR